MARTRAGWTPALVTTSTLSPTVKAPWATPPVTTAPAPAMANDRSIHIRGRPASTGGGADRRTSARAATTSGRPDPVSASHGTTAQCAPGPPARRDRTSATTAATPEDGTVAALVTATSPRSMPASWTMRRCSSVWARQPSPASTHSTTASTTATPASIVAMNRSWPGTSTTATGPTPSIGRAAKPRSMVRPRRFSSASRSGSVPVSARTRVDFPWSTCPAVATTWGTWGGPGHRGGSGATAAATASATVPSSSGATVRRSRRVTPSRTVATTGGSAAAEGRGVVAVDVDPPRRDLDPRQRPPAGHRGAGTRADRARAAPTAATTASARARNRSTGAVAIRQNGSSAAVRSR